MADAYVHTPDGDGLRVHVGQMKQARRSPRRKTTVRKPQSVTATQSDNP